PSLLPRIQQMISDQQGNTLFNATREAADYFDNAAASFNIYRGDPISDIDKAIEAAPDCPMAYLFKAHVFALATEPQLTAAAGDILRDVKAMRLSDRDSSHVNALELLLGGRWTAAAQALDVHNSRYPRDMLAL